MESKNWYIVRWYDRSEPGDEESWYTDLDAAFAFAGSVNDDGGFARVIDQDGKERFPF